MEVHPFRHIANVRHAYTHFKIRMDVFLCNAIKGNITLKGPVDFKWISFDEIEDYPFPKANHKFFQSLKDAIQTGLPFDNAKDIVELNR